MQLLRLLAVAVVLALLGLLVWDVTQSSGSKVAKKVDAGQVVAAPKLVLPYHEGDGAFDLAAQRGKVVVVNFWASWCQGCKKEAAALNAAARYWRDKWGVTGLPETFFVDRKGRVVPPHVLAAATRAQLDEGIRRARRS